MVARAGQPSGWPVSNKAGIPTPVRATLAPTHPQFVFVFAAVRRTERTRRISMLRTVAGDEHTARLSLVRDYILSFAARLPVAEVAHA
jgi:hypothetical protein